ncbi:MAG TPA: hypothetical protein VGF93_06115 [Solirubrobacteraceae bacterium]|jgi:hypothetical protein
MTTIRRISIGLALTLALAAIAAPAFARTFDLNANGSYVPAGAASTQATKPSDSVGAPPVMIVRVAAPGGFDWGDAGIGAAGGLALAMVGLGGWVAVSQSRARRTTGTKAVPSR